MPSDRETVYAEQEARDLYAYVWPYCRRQYPGPHGHHVLGDDSATSCFHARPGERGVTQPGLVRIKVEPAEPFVPCPIPRDQVPLCVDSSDSNQSASQTERPGANENPS